MKQSGKIVPPRFQRAIIVGAFLISYACAESLKEGIENHFAEMKESFNSIAENSAVKKSRLSYTDRFFVRALKKNQTIYALIRTNSKGIIISEIIRGQTPKREYRNIANQQWFKYIARNNKAYDGFLKEEGRYYLFWARPVILTARSGRKRFGGAAAAKVDLWDSFHKFAASVQQPFLIRVNGKSLYSNKWQNESVFQEEKLDIPGVDRIVVRFADASAQDYAAQPEVESDPARQTAGEEIATDAAPAAVEKPKLQVKSYIPLIIGGLVALLILAIALIRLLMWIRYKRLISKIDKGED